MVSSITSATDTTSAAASMKKSLGMNKDDFMQLFIAQLKYQDPLKPQDASAMLDQLSQLTLVEQSYNNTNALQNLLTAQNNASTMSSVSFIGKDVKANGNSVAFDGNTPAALQFKLDSAAASANIVISNSAGQLVRMIPAASLPAGDTSVIWDGRDSSGSLVPAGAYNFSVTGTQADGRTATATTYTTGKIDGVSMAGSNPMLTIGSLSINFSDVISIKGV